MYEVFDEVQKAPTKKDKILCLQKNYDYTLRCVLRAAFHPNIRFVITGDIPQYTPDKSPIGLAVISMNNVVDKLYLFEVGNTRTDPNLTLKRKKELFIQFLEGLEAREAEILVQIINKKIECKGLTYLIVKEALPELELP